MVDEGKDRQRGPHRIITTKIVSATSSGRRDKIEGQARPKLLPRKEIMEGSCHHASHSSAQMIGLSPMEDVGTNSKA